MLKFLKSVFDRWNINSLEKEVLQYMKILKGLDSVEIADLIIASTAIRNKFLLDFQVDLFLMKINDEHSIEVYKAISRMVFVSKEHNQPFMAAGYMLWLHTLRCISEPELRLHGKEMWREVSRGIPAVALRQEHLENSSGHKLDVSGYDKIPCYLKSEQ